MNWLQVYIKSDQQIFTWLNVKDKYFNTQAYHKELCWTTPEVIILLPNSHDPPSLLYHSAPSRQQWGCMITATTKEPSLCSKRLWWSTIKQIQSAGPCVNGRRSLRATTISATVTASMNSYQVRANIWTGSLQQKTVVNIHLSCIHPQAAQNMWCK